jgi:hypothetical protein
MASDSGCHLNKHYASVNNDIVVSKTGGTGQGHYFANWLDTRGTGGALTGCTGIRNVSSGSVIFARVGVLFVCQSGTGIEDSGAGFGHIHFWAADLYLAGNSAVGISAQSANTNIIGYIDHILETGSPTTTTGILVSNSGAIVKATITEIIADAAYNISAGTLHLVCSSLTGTRTGTPVFEMSPSTLSGTNTGNQTITLTGDVTGTGTGSFAATIGDDKVTYAKLQNASAGNVVLARAAGTSGDYSEVALSASQLLGRGASGDVAAITLGTNLSMTGATLNAATGAGVSDGATLSTGLTFPNTGLHVLDTNASHDLIIAPGSDLTADRTLTVTTGDGDRTLTINASTTLGGGTHSGTNTGDEVLPYTLISSTIYAASNASITPAAGWTACRVRGCGGGGGGGGGSINASSAVTGGGGGQGGVGGEYLYTKAEMETLNGGTFSTVAVTIGGGGSGGAGRTGAAGAGNGSNGTTGSDSTFDTGSTQFIVFAGGSRGQGGAATVVVVANTASFDSGPYGSGGGAAGNTVTAGAAGANPGSRWTGGGGGGGGGYNASGTGLAASAGGLGSQWKTGGNVFGGGGAAGTTGATATAGTAGTAKTRGGDGGGGGGGTNSTTTNAGNGGAGGNYGGGGGGGGSIRATVTSGIDAGTGGAGVGGYIELEWLQ